ncbi:MAG: biotin--[acetyl-CoA-carboxylase] ligase, partial [Cyanobacteria bacterium REEB65]|nr:biotin--[acetyl-CoA-carboxylase] ligase [Cyanobacteria bacterium REEB65]
MRLLHLPEVDSTSDHLRRLATAGSVEPWTVVMADRQTAGHGQHGRTWASPRGGLYLTILLEPDVASPVFTLLAGVATLRACDAATGASNLGLKWVNDLVWQEPESGGIPRRRKIGGIL